MTTPYSIKIAPAALRQILALDARHQKDILRLIEALAVNPRPPGVQKIEGMTGLNSHSINHLRLIFKVDEQDILLLLIK